MLVVYTANLFVIYLNPNSAIGRLLLLDMIENFSLKIDLLAILRKPNWFKWNLRVGEWLHLPLDHVDALGLLHHDNWTDARRCQCFDHPDVGLGVHFRPEWGLGVGFALEEQVHVQRLFELQPVECFWQFGLVHEVFWVLRLEYDWVSVHFYFELSALCMVCVVLIIFHGLHFILQNENHHCVDTTLSIQNFLILLWNKCICLVKCNIAN